MPGIHPRWMRRLARNGEFPAPLDPSRRVWLWNPLVIDAYIRGEWAPAPKDDAA